MLLWISESCTIRSLRPSRWPITVTFVECPPTRATASSAPWMRANARSSSRWIGRSPETMRLAETEVPYRSIAALAAVGDPRVAIEPDVVVGGEIRVGAVADHCIGAGDALVHAEKRIADAEVIRRLLDHANVAVRLEPRHVEAAGIRPRASPVARCRRLGRRNHPRRRRGQLFDEPRLGLGGQSEQVAARRHPRYSAASDLNSSGSNGSAASATAASRSSSAAS